jgi:hypothetical protein
VSEESRKIWAEIQAQWRNYLDRLDSSDTDKIDALLHFRKTFPFGSPAQFEGTWTKVTQINTAVGSHPEPSLSKDIPAPAALPVPPPVGKALIGVFCSREMREAVLGDLDEKFAELAERRGAGAAKAWYWGQAGRSVLFFAVRWGRRLLELEAILKRIL